MIKDRQRWFRVHVHLVLHFLLCINQSGHNIYQIEAEYLSYRMVPVMLLLVKEFKVYVLKRTEIDIFSHQFF